MPASSGMFYWWADRVWFQGLVLVSMSVLSIIGMTQPTLVTGWFAHDPPADVESSEPDDSLADELQEVEEPPRPPDNVQPFRVGGGECVLVAVIGSLKQGDDVAGDGEKGGPSRDLFTKSSLATMRRVCEGLEEMPQVASVMWLDSVPSFNLFGLSGTLLPSENASPRQMAHARQTVLRNPLAVGQLISGDGKTVLMHIDLDWFAITSDEEATTAIRERAEQIAVEVSGEIKGSSEISPIRFRLTGPVPLHAMTASNHVRDSAKYQMIGYGIMIISALVLFRGVSAVLIVAMAPAFGVFWTSGMLHFFNLQENPFNDIIVPVLISLVGLADAVHLMVEIRQQRAGGLEPRDAARLGIARVGLACLLTSLTTAIGFFSLTWAHHEIVRDFGWCCVVGVAMTFVSVLTVIPLGCRSPLGRRLHVGLGKSLVDGQLRRIGPVVDFVLKHDRATAIFAIVATILLAAVSLRLQPDEKRYSGLSESGEAALALRHLDKTLGGLESGHVSVNWDQSTSKDDILRVLERVDAALAKEPLMGHPLGLHDLLAALPGDGAPSERMALLDLLPPSLKRAFYTPEYRSARVQFRIQDLGIAAYGPTFQRIEESLADIKLEHPAFQISLAGNAAWRWKNVYQIVTDLATSLGTASVVIWLVLTLFYRSIRVGLISIVPNLFPLAATGSMLVVLGLHLEMVTVCVFTICVGIAVDDTIHFLTRYQEECKRGGDHQSIIRRSFTGVGSALIMTTLVLVTGLGSAILGDSRDARIFGIMGCLTLTAALLADILFLPALLSRFDRPKTLRQRDVG